MSSTPLSHSVGPEGRLRDQILGLQAVKPLVPPSKMCSALLRSLGNLDLTSWNSSNGSKSGLARGDCRTRFNPSRTFLFPIFRLLHCQWRGVCYTLAASPRLHIPVSPSTFQPQQRPLPPFYPLLLLLTGFGATRAQTASLVSHTINLVCPP